MRGSQGLPAEKQREILDLLLSPDRPAPGLSILRLGIAPLGAPSSRPTRAARTPPPSTSGTARTTGQVWLAQQAQAYGVHPLLRRRVDRARLHEDQRHRRQRRHPVWPLRRLLGERRLAPGRTRTSSIQYAKFYGQEGIGVTDLGFTNEPDWHGRRTTPCGSLPPRPSSSPRSSGRSRTRPGTRSPAAIPSAGTTQKVLHSARSRPTRRPPVRRHPHRPHLRQRVDGRRCRPQKRTWMSEWSPDGTTWNDELGRRQRLRRLHRRLRGPRPRSPRATPAAMCTGTAPRIGAHPRVSSRWTGTQLHTSPSGCGRSPTTAASSAPGHPHRRHHPGRQPPAVGVPQHRRLGDRRGAQRRAPAPSRCRTASRTPGSRPGRRRRI